MEACHVIVGDSPVISENDGVSSSLSSTSVLISDKSVNCDEIIDPDVSMTENQCNKETAEGSVKSGDFLTDAFLADLLSTSSNLDVDNLQLAINEGVHTVSHVETVLTGIPPTNSVIDPVSSSQSESYTTPTEIKINNAPIAESAVNESTNNVQDFEGSVTVIENNCVSIEQNLEQSCISTLAPAVLNNEYRCNSDWSEDESSDSSSDSDSFLESLREGSTLKKFPLVKTKGELDLDDLPPIEDLVITVSVNEMEKIGKVYAIVDKLVVIRALKGSKALDLESVLFLSHDRPLGRVFDVFGPVIEPFYSIRFNNADHINEKGVKVDADVYFAPEKNDITMYVLVDHLQNQVGSDASWKHNNEPPEEYLDYSDDEKERVARRQRMSKNRNNEFKKSDIPLKRPHLPVESSTLSAFIPPPRPPPPRRNIQGASIRYSQPYSFPISLSSYSPSTPCYEGMSCVHIRNPYHATRPDLSQSPFAMCSPQAQLPIQYQTQIQYQIQRPPPSPLMLTSYRPPVFGQVSIYSPVSTALHSPSQFQSQVLGSVPALLPAHISPQNYFSQRFPRSPSPAVQNGPISPEPWLPNRAPVPFSNLPPNAPLTVQIPPNISSPTLPMHSFEQVNTSVQPFVNQPFVNQNVNFPHAFANQRNVNFPNGHIQRGFY